MTIIIKNASIEFEDFREPSKFRRVRLILDVYTKERYLYLNLDKVWQKNIINFRIRSLNPFYSLNFVFDEKVIVDFGNLDKWPLEFGIKNEEKQYYIKLEIIYDEINPHFEDLMYFKGYNGIFCFPIVVPEFSITVPKGMKLDNGKKVKIVCTELNQDSFIEKDIELILIKDNDNRTYFFLINMDIFKALTTKHFNICVSYSVEYDINIKLLGALIVAIILIIYSLDELYRTVFANSFGMPEVGLLLAVFSLTALILQMKNQKYQIRGYKFIISSIGFTLIVILIILLIYLFHSYYTFLNKF